MLIFAISFFHPKRICRLITCGVCGSECMSWWLCKLCNYRINWWLRKLCNYCSMNVLIGDFVNYVIIIAVNICRLVAELMIAVDE